MSPGPPIINPHPPEAVRKLRNADPSVLFSGTLMLEKGVQYISESDTFLLTYLDQLADEAPDNDLGRYRRWHDQYYGWYASALQVELAHRSRLHRFTAAEILKLGMKAAPGNTTIHLIADWTGHEESAVGAVTSVMQLSAGLQVLDDLNDLSEDFSGGNYSMPVTETVLSLGPDNSPENLQPDDLLAVAADSGVFANCLDISESLFSLAACTAASVGANVISELAATWGRRVEMRSRPPLQGPIPWCHRRVIGS